MLKYIGEELFAYGIIGEYDDETISAGEFIELLAQKRGKRVKLHVNSIGGEITNGIAIANAIEKHPGGVDIVNDAMAASITSYIAVSGVSLTMTEGSRMMIHNPWTLAVGDAREMRAAADMLDTARDSMIGRYAKKTGKTPEEIMAMLDAETWMTADAAVEYGFADTKDGVAVEKPKIVKAACNSIPDGVELVSDSDKLSRTYAEIRLRMVRAQLGLFDKKS